MSITPVLQQLIKMMHGAGISISDEDLTATYLIKVESPDPQIVYAEFKEFAHMPFDCSSFDNDDEEKYECVEWKDECILFECGIARYSNTPTFYFGFKRAFSIKFKHEDGDTLYSDLITCSLEYELKDELAATEIIDYAFPPYNEPSGLDEFFADIEALHVYPLLMNKYRPKCVSIYQSD